MADTGPGPIAAPGITQGCPAAEMLEDWITVWQSELAALVLDREMQEAALRMIDGWAAQARIAAQMIGPALDAARRHAGAASPPGAATPVPADGRDDLIAQLLDRVAELERRLARLDRA